MNIKESIRECLNRRRWNASKLARESGVKLNSITRVLNGKRKGMHSDTVEKLMPFLVEIDSKDPPS